ncbi:hypothetical protein KFL_000130190 [Klebsormidium nitens]|uniref:Uncharacterized protein n=1 Tax=Klebsormidium nitens TaxID=105231 RepID=A0A1Y1HRH4_KLENI|nr:hypothetical protein KFL_000130190 [Klebsormidium nitens]|eukprot:GAQ78438.1 hypothetical protein KFL_000130190 [Klebsormidium nitens]
MRACGWKEGAKVLELTANKDVVRALFGLLIEEADTNAFLPEIVGCLERLASIPPFSRQFDASDIAPLVAEFFEDVFPQENSRFLDGATPHKNYLAGTRKYRPWEVLQLAFDLTRHLFEHTPEFTTEALHSGLLPALLKLIPFRNPAPSNTLRLLISIVLVQNVCEAVAAFFRDGAPTREWASEQVGPAEWACWVSDVLSFLRRAAASAHAPEAGCHLTALMALVQVISLLADEFVGREIFTPAVVTNICDGVNALFEVDVANIGTFKKIWQSTEFRLKQISSLTEANPAEKRLKEQELEEKSRAAFQEALDLLKKLKAGEGDAETLETLIVKSLYALVASELAFAQVDKYERLIAEGAPDVVMRALENETAALPRGARCQLSLEAKEALTVLMVFIGCGGPAQLRGRVAQYNMFYAEGLEDMGPRLLAWAARDYGALDRHDRQDLMQCLFAAFETVPGRKYRHRYALVELAVRTIEEDEVKGGSNTGMAWKGLASLALFLPEYSPALVARLEAFELLPEEERLEGDAYEALVAAMADEIDRGAAALVASGTVMRVARLAARAIEGGDVALGVALGEGRTRSNPFCPAIVLQTLSAAPEVVSDVLIPVAAGLVACLGGVYAHFSSVFRGGEFRLCYVHPEDDRKPIEGVPISELIVATTLDEDERDTWHETTEALPNLLDIFGRALHRAAGDAALKERFVSEVVSADGIGFSAAVLRTRAAASSYLADCYPPTLHGVATWLPILQETAKRVWAMLAERFGLEECAYPDCAKDVVEVSKGTFNKPLIGDWDTKESASAIKNRPKLERMVLEVFKASLELGTASEADSGTDHLVKEFTQEVILAP